MSHHTLLQLPGRVAIVAIVSIVAVGCATSSRQTTPDQTATVIQSPAASVARDASITPRPSRPSDVVTVTELSLLPPVLTTYDAVARLRPSFLRPRDARTPAIASRTFPAVFVNGVFQGEVDALRAIPVSSVAEVQFVRSIDAMHRFGPDYGGGVILVRLR